jgi:hypothetical protein
MSDKIKEDAKKDTIGEPAVATVRRRDRAPSRPGIP